MSTCNAEYYGYILFTFSSLGTETHEILVFEDSLLPMSQAWQHYTNSRKSSDSSLLPPPTYSLVSSIWQPLVYFYFWEFKLLI